MEYLICAKASFEILINGRMGAENWMKAGCVALLPYVEVAMVCGQSFRPLSFLIWSVGETR